MNLKSTHLLSIDQLTKDAVEELLQSAASMEPIARRQKITRVLEGALLGNLFFEPSTRTRISFAAAFCRLGGAVCETTGFAFSSMAKGESIYDTSRTISGYVDAMVIRHPEQGAVTEFAAATNIPVINAGDGPGEHPTQALLDLYTIQKEFARLNKKIAGAHIAIVGDLKYGRTVHSLLKLLALYPALTITLLSPPSLAMPSAILDQVSNAGHKIVFGYSLQDSLSNADIVYATRIQKERLAATENSIDTEDFQINQKVISKFCSAQTVVMHPLPRDSREGAYDLSTDLNRDSRLAIFRQTDNGICIRMAIFAAVLGVSELVMRNLRDVPWRKPKQIGSDDAPFYRLQD